MVSDIRNPMHPESGRYSIRLPHWGWFLLGSAVLVIAYGSLSIWLPHYRDQQLIQKIESWDGVCRTESSAPDWLRQFLRMTNLEVFERITFVDLQGRAIADS